MIDFLIGAQYSQLRARHSSVLKATNLFNIKIERLWEHIPISLLHCSIADEIVN